MTVVEIKELSPDNSDFWDNIVEISPQGTLFHKIHFLKIVEKYTNSTLHCFAGYIGNELVAAVPFFSKKRYSMTVFLSPIESAFIQNLGPIFPNYDGLKQDKKEYYFREFQCELDAYLDKNFHITKITLTTSPHLIDARPFVWNNYQIIPKYNYIKNISNLLTVWTDFKKQLRKNIEKADKSGVVIREGGLEDLQKIQNSLLNRLNEQNINLKISSNYLTELYNFFHPNNLKIFVAEYKDEFVTGIIVIVYKNKISIWIGAIQTDLKGLYPVDLLHWKIIEWGHNNGYEFCEIFGANMPTISYFKSKYNFDLDIYWHATKNKRSDFIKKCKNCLGIIKKRCVMLNRYPKNQ